MDGTRRWAWAAAGFTALLGLAPACDVAAPLDDAGPRAPQAAEALPPARRVALPPGPSGDAAAAQRPSGALGHLDPRAATPSAARTETALATAGPARAAHPAAAPPAMPAPAAPTPAAWPTAPSIRAELPPTPEVDCSAIPEGPFTMTKLTGPVASEDLAFDRHGHLIGSNDKAIFKSQYNKSPQLFVPNFNFRAGLRALPNGHLIVCDNNKGELVRIDEQGLKWPLVTGLSYPNGIEIDLNGWIYFSEHDADVVWRVHPFTGAKTMITDKVTNPNGLAFSPDYKTLYIGGFNGNPTIYAVSISPDGVPGKLVPFASVGSGWHDGMAVDACGNVYVADYNQTRIYRITPDGQSAKVIIDGNDFPNAYLPNMQWGTGVGGWDPLSLYIPDGWNKGVFEVEIGVPSKPTAYNP